MYKINYQSGKGRTEILRICQKQDNHWIEIENSEIKQKIAEKHFNLTHFNQDSDQTGYGEFVVSDSLAFITGDFIFFYKL